MNSVLSEMTPFIVMDVLERAQQLEKQGINIIHMEVGEPDFSIPEAASIAAIKAQQNGQTKYTHSLGNKNLREAIAKLHTDEYGVKVNPDCIVITSGSSPAILMAVMTLCDAGDEVILSNPCYPCYRNFVLACHAKPVYVDVWSNNGFLFDIDAVKAAITPKTKAVFVNSPMNPAGTIVPPEIYKQLALLNIPIISDEIYHGLVYEGKAHSVLEFTNNAFVINGFSKRYAMTGLRLGYAIVPEKFIRNVQILQQNLMICAPSTAQVAGLAAMTQCKKEENLMRETYNKRRIFMIKRLREIGFKIDVEPQGAFYIFADARSFTNDSYKFAFEVLENAHVGITPGVDFGTNGEGFIRFSYANSMKNLTEGLNRLEKYLKNR